MLIQLSNKNAYNHWKNSPEYSFFTAKDKGPFRRLTQPVQRLAIEVLFHLSPIDGKLLQVLVSCCQDDADVNISVIEYIVQVLYYRCDMEKKKNNCLYFNDFCLVS